MRSVTDTHVIGTQEAKMEGTGAESWSSRTVSSEPCRVAEVLTVAVRAEGQGKQKYRGRVVCSAVGERVCWVVAGV